MNNLRPSGIFFLLTLLLAAAQAANDAAHRSCCLCGGGGGGGGSGSDGSACAAPSNDKMDLVLLDLTLLQQGEPTTCADLVASMEQEELVDGEDCRELQDLHSEACCSEGFDVVLEEDEDANLQVDGLYVVGGLKSNSNKCSDNRYASNDVTFDTPGGACECPVCRSGSDPTGWYGAAVLVPGRGQYAGSCQQLNELGKDGWLTNGFCTPFQNALGPDCCTPTEEIKDWTAYSGAPPSYDQQSSSSSSGGSGSLSSSSMPTSTTVVMLIAAMVHGIFLVD